MLETNSTVQNLSPPRICSKHHVWLLHCRYISRTLSRINFSLILSRGSLSLHPVDDLPVQLRPANSPMLNISKTTHLLRAGASEQRLLSFIARKVSTLYSSGTVRFHTDRKRVHCNNLR